MADEWKLLIAKAGYNWNDADIRNIVFDSDKTMLKEAVILSGYLDFSPGDTYKEISIAHGLGYTPWFIPYMKNGTTGEEEVLPVIPVGIEGPAFSACVDSTHVKFKADFGYGYNEGFYPVDSFYTNDSSYYKAHVGDEDGGKDCAMCFKGDYMGPIIVEQGASIHSASIDFWVSEKTGSSDTKIKVWGIDVDDYNGGASSDLGLQKTDAFGEQNVAAGSNSYFGINVGSQVQEIVNRASYTPGAFGFFVFNNGSPSGCSVKDYNWNSFLRVRINGTLRLYFKAVVFADKIL